MLLRAGAALGALCVLLVVLFVAGIPLPGNLARSPIETLLADVFGVPTRVEGPLRLRTGLVASAEAGAVIVVDPSNPAGPPLMRAHGVSVRVDILALLRRAVVLEEISSEQVEIRLARATDGRGNWEPVIATSGGPAPVQFAGIGQLRISALQGSYNEKPGAEPVRWELKEFEGSLLGRNPVTAQGTLSFAGWTLALNASSASLAELLEGSGKPIPLTATVDADGARIEASGTFAPASTALDTSLHIQASNADMVLARFGAAASEAGALDARGKVQVRVRERDAVIEELALRLGQTAASGKVGVDWSGSRPKISLDIAAQRLDENPFVTGKKQALGRTTFEGYVQLLQDVTSSIDLDAKVSVAQFVGLVSEMRNYSLDARIADRVLAARTSADVLGMKSNVTIDYSARAPKRVLSIRIEGKRFSTEQLPGGSRPGAVSATIGGLRGAVHGSGMDTQELVGAARVNLDARDLRFSWPRERRATAEIRLDSARLDIESGRSARAVARGRVAGRRCSLEVSGGTLISLIGGDRWPLRLDASCRGAKLVSKGHVIVKGQETTAALKFEGTANPVGALGGPLGLATDVPHDFAMSGELALTEALVDVRLARFRLGRTAGSGTALVTREGTKAHRIEVALKTVNVDELATLAPRGEKKAPADVLAREVLPVKVHVPDLDLRITADTVRYGAQSIRRMRLDAAPRAGHVRNADFGFRWRGAAVAGELSADLRGAHPTIALRAAVENADLAAAFEDKGHKLPFLRAEKIQARARAAGVKLGDLLASATAEAEIINGRLANVRQYVPGLGGDAEFSATLAVMEKQPVKATARGTAGGSPFEISIDTEPLEKLVQRKGRLPGALRASLGEIRLEAAGDMSFEGALDARVTLSGRRLDRLGRLAGVRLPEVEPYSATANVAVAPDSLRASGVDAKFGNSQVLGKVSMKLAEARPALAAELRAPVLHLEDLGLHLFLVTSGQQKTAGTSAPPADTGAAQRIARIEKLLRTLDAKATLSIEALYGEGKRYARLRTSAALQDGDLHVSVRDMYVSGGKANADWHIEANVSGPRMRLRALTEGFEFGPLAEALRPNTPLEGTLDLLLDVSLERLQEPLLGNLDGRIDFAVFPRGLQLGAADYWGTGVLHVMQRTIDSASESRLNCAVTLLDIKNGVARSEAFFADTTRVRIIGDIEANLVTRKLSGRLSPSAKNPSLLTVSPSVGIGGTLESPKVELTPESLITTPLRLVFPIHAFALDWLSASSVPADGSDGCRQAFKRAVGTRAQDRPPPSQKLPRIWPF